MAVPAERDDRANPRTNLFLSAVLVTDGRRLPVRLRDISIQGARIEGAELPEPGSPIEIIRAENRLVGRAMWKKQHRCGVMFDDEIDLAKWTPTKSSQKQASVDKAIATIRGASTDGASQDAPLQVPDARLAEELDLVKRSVGVALDELSEYPILIHRAPLTLQRLERVANTLMHLTTILEARDRASALYSIGMSDLVRRLTR